MKGFYKCLNIFVDHRINGKAFDLFFFYQKQMFSRQERNTETKREKL